jgi:16S rRNA (adenine1518-N6/adenine1519-N6)-dimethyltransferase
MITPDRPKKSLGQHFLTSTSAIESMLRASGTIQTDTILEIGPGRGVLTEALLKTGATVIAVEKDDQLIPVLSEKFKTHITSGQLQIIHGDVLNENTLLGIQNREYKLVANIPYYITGEIIRTFLTAKSKPTSITILVQKEVAERIVAKDGKESVLSLSVKFFGTPTYIQTVKRGSFNPPPNVDSAILHIEIWNKKYEIKEEEFFQIVKTGFKSKRKKLISNLSDIYDKSALSRAFEELALSENSRAEELKIDQWLTLIVLLGARA